MSANPLAVSRLWGACQGLFIAAAILAQAKSIKDHPLQADITNTGDGGQDALNREYMQLHTVAHVDKLAICNDRSPGAYYHRPGTADNSTRWVVRFLGGAWCWDGPSCAARNASTPYLMSTSALPARTSARSSARGLPDVILQSHGITSTDAAQNPDFSSWNHVHVWYCSSDSHLGDASPGSKSDFGGWHFRGRRIAAAVITDLLTVWGLNNATHVLLTGDSAGGVGVMNLADDIATTLRVEAPALETVKLFVDAGWFLDIPSYSNRSDGMTFEKCAKALPASYRAVFDRSCEEHFGAEDSWRCFFAQDCQAFLETPTLFHEYLYDSANLGYDGAGSPAEAEDFRSRLEASIKAAAAAGGTGSCAGDSSEEDASPDGRHTQNVSRIGKHVVRRVGSRDARGSGALALGDNGDAHGSSGGTQERDGMVKGGGGSFSVGDRREMKQNADMLSLPSGSRPNGNNRTSGIAASQQVDADLLSNASMTCSGHTLQRWPNIFAPACQLHEMIDCTLFTKSHVGDVRFVHVLGAWFAGELSNVHVLDGHGGVRGGDECGVYPALAKQLAAVVSVGV